MKYKVVVAFGTYCVGNVIEPTGLYRDQLIGRRWIEPLADGNRVAAPTEAAIMPEPETAALDAPKRRGRPPRIPVEN